MPRVPVRIVFVLLVCATLGAFFITQRLKRTEAVVNRVYVKPKHFSPNRDGVNEHTGISFRLRDGDHVTATVVDDKGDAVRTLALDRYLGPGFYRFTWDGRTDAGGRAPDGTYFLRVSLRRKGLAATAPKKIFLDARPPRPVPTRGPPPPPRRSRPPRSPPSRRSSRDRTRAVVRGTGGSRSRGG